MPERPCLLFTQVMEFLICTISTMMAGSPTISPAKTFRAVLDSLPLPPISSMTNNLCHLSKKNLPGTVHMPSMLYLQHHAYAPSLTSDKSVPLLAYLPFPCKSAGLELSICHLSKGMIYATDCIISGLLT